MTGFSQLIGHEDTIQHLQSAIAQGKVSHAYIFQGAPGSGKKTLADAFAQTLQCETLQTALDELGGVIAPSGDGETVYSRVDACGICTSCRQAADHNHPDIVYVTHEKEKTLSVSEIREQIVGDIGIRPYAGRYKIYIVPDAELMNAEAQNALLKTLEEPPAYAVILLLTTHAASFLDTVRSRCVLLDLKPVRDDQVMAYLMEHMEIPDYQARLCAAFAQGSIGKAMQLAGSASYQELRELAVRTAVQAGTMDTAAITEKVAEFSAFKDMTEDLFDIWTSWYRDVLLFKAMRHADALIFRDQLQAIRQMASVCSYEGIENVLRAIDTARGRLRANVNYDLTMELLLMTMRDCVR